MKINDIKIYPVWVGTRNQLIVKVETDSGIHGWGEAGVSSRELAVEAAVRHFMQFLIGKDPRQIGALWQEMYRGQYFEGGRILVGAISAIDIALHDIVARSLGVPVYQLLGGRQRDFVPCFATTSGPTAETLIENAKCLLDHGWSIIRTAPVELEADEGIFEPRKSIAATADQLVALREAIGNEPVIGIDYR